MKDKIRNKRILSFSSNDKLSKIQFYLKFLYKVLLGILFLVFYYILKILEIRREEGKKVKVLLNIQNKYRHPEIKIDVNFEYHNFQRELISEKIKNNSNWLLSLDEVYFLNGIIRKFKPKKYLEIGVAYGGSSVVILNAIKDINDSFLISLDLYNKMGNSQIGENVIKYFPELMNKWQLFTGDQPHKFLDKLNLTFDFLFLDTAHVTPGEVINIIEALPFLEENAIIVIHDIMFHFGIYHINYPKIHYSNIYVMTSLMGDKVIKENKKIGLENIGAVRLFPNQEKYYLNYFLLLLAPWEYMPNEKHIEDLRIFIKKYYKKDIYLNLFNKAVQENKIYTNK